MSTNSTLGDFLRRQHGLKARRSVITTTTTMYISDFDDDEWCLVKPNSVDKNVNIHNDPINLSQRVNYLENQIGQLLDRVCCLENQNNTPQQKAIAPPQQKLIGYPSNSNNLQIALNTKPKYSNNNLRDQLILQKKLILKNAKKKNMKKKNKKNKCISKKSTHPLAKRNPKHYNLFVKELSNRVKNPCLKEAWHILKARKVEDPHKEALMKLREACLIKKSELRHVEIPVKSVIILD